MTEVEQTQEDTTQEVKPTKKTRGKGAAVKPVVEGGEKVTRGRASTKFSNEAKITLISATNPKRPGSKAADDWTKYTDGMTVGEALAAGISRADILYNASHKFLDVEGYDAPEPRKQVRKPKEEVSADAPAEETVAG